MVQRSGELRQDTVGDLPRKLRRAVEYATRRRILRTLNTDGEDRTLHELATLFPQDSVSEISYHLEILEECGAVTLDGNPPDDLIASSVTDDHRIRAVPDTMRADDEAGE